MQENQLRAHLIQKASCLAQGIPLLPPSSPARVYVILLLPPPGPVLGYVRAAARAGAAAAARARSAAEAYWHLATHH
eukprot:scaffold4001_cov25-Tisochrysis_lutea.AAC.2